MAVPHPQKLAVLSEPISDALPFPQQRFVRDAHGDLPLRIGVGDQHRSETGNPEVRPESCVYRVNNLAILFITAAAQLQAS